MRILQIESTPLRSVLYRNAGKRGRTEIGRLDLVRARVDRIPAGAQALLLTADLQGVAPSPKHGGESRLLGIVLSEMLQELADSGEIPPGKSAGVVLAGDFYSSPGADERGATGDVTSVWETFRDFAAWVVGVKGNHDLISPRLARSGSTFALDGECVTLGDSSFAGVSFIGGDETRTGRRSQEEQIRKIAAVTSQRPQFLVLHEGPPGANASQRGSQFVADSIDPAFSGVIVCGHKHWPTPLSSDDRRQIVNVHERAVLITR